MSYALFPRTLEKHRAWHFPPTPVTTTRGTTPPGNLYRTSLNATGLPALTGDIASPCLNTFHHTFVLTSLLCEVNRAFHSFYCFLTYRLLKEVLTRINNWYAVTITMKENWSCLFFKRENGIGGILSEAQEPSVCGVGTLVLFTPGSVHYMRFSSSRDRIITTHLWAQFTLSLMLSERTDRSASTPVSLEKVWGLGGLDTRGLRQTRGNHIVCNFK